MRVGLEPEDDGALALHSVMASWSIPTFPLSYGRWAASKRSKARRVMNTQSPAGSIADVKVTLADLARHRASGNSITPRPFWWEAAPPTPGGTTALDAEADVVVIGAGFTGLVAALNLARAGRHVIVVDAGVLGLAPARATEVKSVAGTKSSVSRR